MSHVYQTQRIDHLYPEKCPLTYHINESTVLALNNLDGVN